MDRRDIENTLAGPRLLRFARPQLRDDGAAEDAIPRRVLA